PSRSHRSARSSHRQVITRVPASARLGHRDHARLRPSHQRSAWSRHCDISWEGGRLEVTGTLIDDTDDWHLVRQEELKGRGQARIIELPKYALKALAAARLNASTIP